MYLKTNCENKKPYQLGNYPCQLGLFPYFLPKTHSWYYPIIRDFSLFIRQKSLIVMVLWAHFSQKATSIFTAKFFMNFLQILNDSPSDLLSHKSGWSPWKTSDGVHFRVIIHEMIISWGLQFKIEESLATTTYM